jgi:hypothetical protein
VAFPSAITQFTQADLLALVDRLLPISYLDPLKNPGPGYEALQAFAQLFSRASLAVKRLGDGVFIVTASGGALATGNVQLYRLAPNQEGISVTVKAGTIVSASKSGVTFQTTADQVFILSDLGPFTVPVQATAVGYEYNVTGEVTTADGTLLSGEIDTVVTLVEDPDFGDSSILVKQAVSTSGGADAFLDQQGLDRGIARGVMEGDDPYRLRVRSLPDTISPDAVDRLLQLILAPYGAVYQFTETWELEYQTCWDAPPDPIPGSTFDPTLFVYDDPRSASPFRNRWLDLNDYRGGFIIAVPDIGPVTDYGMAYDDTAGSAMDLTYAHGARALGAYDVPASLGFGYLQGAWDGFDTTKAAVYKSIFDTLQQIKAAGNSAALELLGQ